MANPFPISVSPNRRCLVDRQGQPFLIQGDSPWSLISALSREEVEQYLVDRASQGFNALIVNLVEHKFNGPRNRYGQLPFAHPEDLGGPNPGYFEHADWVVERAAHYGMLVFLDPLFLGFRNKNNDEGWYEEVVRGGAPRCYQFGQYVGQRYAGFTNLVWLIGADRNPAALTHELSALVAGIKEFDTHSLMTASPAPEDATLQTFGFGGWLDFNSTYTYQLVVHKLLRDYNSRPTMPFVLLESSYEGEHNAPPQQIRRQAYWALLCGACGQFIGNRPAWLFDSGWQATLDLPASRDMHTLNRLFKTLPWSELVPDQNHQIVTAGLGESNGMDVLAAAATQDRRMLAAYLPTPRRITVDLRQMEGSQFTAGWFDPASGVYSYRGVYPAAAPVELTPPGTHEGDWVLIMERVT